MRLLRFTTSITVFSTLSTLAMVGCGTLVGLPPEPSAENDASPNNDAAIDAPGDTTVAHLDGGQDDATADANTAPDASDASDATLLPDADAASDADAPDAASAPDSADAADAADAAIPDATLPDATLTDAALPDAADAAPDPLSACETDVINEWMQRPQAVGIGTHASLNTYDGIIEPLMQQNNIPGGAIAVMRDGKLVMMRGYGYADRGTFTFAHPDTMFRMASLTKQITSAAILVMVQKGLIGLDDKAFTLLSDLTPLPGQTLNPQLANITIRQLLQHTGGWNSAVEGDPMFQTTAIAVAAGTPAPADSNTIIRYMLSRPLTYTPGTTMSYSNFGYCVLGAIVEKVTGTKFETWVDANVLGPAHAQGLTIGHTLLQDRLEEEAVYSDFPGDGPAPSVYPNQGTVPWQYGGFSMDAMWADGAWVGSPIDFLRFQGSIDGRLAGIPAILDATRLAALAANPGVPSGQSDGGTTAPSTDYWYGLGWQVNRRNNWWHSGKLHGTATFQVHTAKDANGIAFGWAAFFNSCPENAAFFNQLDDALWQAHDNTTSWSTEDFFDAYAAPFTAWMTTQDYQTTFTAQMQTGHIPVRVEGRLQNGTPYYRGRFAPVHGLGFNAVHGNTCLEYKANKASFEALGQTLVTLQSFVSSDGHRRYQAVWAQ